MSVKKMNKAQLIEELASKGIEVSEELTKAQLIELFENSNKSEGVVVEMNNEVKAVEEVQVEGIEVAEEVMKDQAVELQNIEDVENPIVGEWYFIDGTVKQYEAPVSEVEAPLETPEVEIIEDENKQVEAPQAAPTDKVEAVEEDKPKAAGRAAGIGVQFYLNEELQDVYPSIQAAARAIKVFLNRDTMPYTLIHKSIRDYIDYTHTDGSVLKFRFENEADKKQEYKTRTSKSSGSRGAGKLVDWFENGEFKQQFPSIKAAVEFMKDYLKLPHNPYTAVLKSLNENQDFNQHSFSFSTEVREAAQAVASEQPQQVVEEAQVEEQEIVEAADVQVELGENEEQQA